MLSTNCLIKNKLLWCAKAIVLMFIFLLLGGCSQVTIKSTEKQAKIISDIAYDVSKQENNVVYIEENGNFVPFLVVSANYGGNTLLLRKYILDCAMPFNNNKRQMWTDHEYGGYYEGSSIDNFLNTEFINLISQSARDAIAISDIVITDKSSLGVTGNVTTTVSREIFILSLNELGGAPSRASVPEGKTLSYFANDYSRRVTSFQNGDASAYWTRTPETWETYTVFTIGSRTIGSASADIQSGVRPPGEHDDGGPRADRRPRR
jgi:hypothetical protein